MEPRSPAAHRTKDFAALQTKTPAIAAGVALRKVWPGRPLLDPRPSWMTAKGYSAARDGRFLILAIKENGKNPSYSAARDDRFLIFAIQDDGNNLSDSAAMDRRFLILAITDAWQKY
jgi:hypothetical protein